MILTEQELLALIEARHNHPHSLLGMHPLGYKKGIVVRAFLQNAKKVIVEPVHEPHMPRFQLKMLHEAGFFEGVCEQVSRVYAYELVIEGFNGSIRRIRDPYSFLPTLSDFDLYLINEGTHRQIYEKLGSHIIEIDGVKGVAFAVWAPNAQRVSVVGPFNNWDGRYHPMRVLGSSGVWELFIPHLGEGTLYKYEIRDRYGNVYLKTDPYGFFFELPPKNAAIVWDTKKFCWSDDRWLSKRSQTNLLKKPLSIYEVHLGSWKKKRWGESYSYKELAPLLRDYVLKMGFTHVEFLPPTEHAYYPSWGYQVTGYYAPTSRYGTPDEFQELINVLHEAGIGVFIDWVPAHFPKDEWWLVRFDGTCLYEHEDPKKGIHPDWGTLIFNYGRNEVRNYLVGNALFWCERYHIDGLRIDAVASMIYLDYSRKDGEWIPNQYGGKENLEAIAFLRELNHFVHTLFPGVVTIAEESTAWPLVSRPPYVGGLGFTFKWNMGWMHDTLRYFQKDPIYRKYHHNDLTFAMMYHYSENFILPLSHDEVVHGKRSLRNKMPGDEWQGFANLRALLAYQWTFPGKQLLFMGGEIGQKQEWNENGEIDWWLVHEGPYHIGVQRLVQRLNQLYISHPALWEADYEPIGFKWIDCSDAEHSILSFIRKDSKGEDLLVIILNLTPLPRYKYRIGLPYHGAWKEILNTDDPQFGGSGISNPELIFTEPIPYHGFEQSAEFILPPLAVLIIKPVPELHK